MTRFMVLFVLLVTFAGCSKDCPPEKVCETCPECPTCPACPVCEVCPTCPAPVEAVASGVLLTTSRSGPETFMSSSAVFRSGHWRQVGKATQAGPESPEGELAADFVGIEMLKAIRRSPMNVGTVAVPDADNFLCQQRAKTMICWVSGETDPRKYLFVQITVTDLLSSDR